MMKKIVVLLLICLLSLGMIACGEKEEEVLSKLGLSRCASYVMEDDK